MSDPREEARELVRQVRRILERDRTSGETELLARSASAARRSVRAAPAPVALPPVPVAPRPTPRGDDAAPSGPSVDLFGKPVAPETPKAADKSATTGSPSSGWSLLNPISPPERDEITGKSLPILDQVASEARACRRCGLCESRIQAVPGVGSARSGIVFVGEAPGAEEDRRGEPFVGRAGELLTKVIQAMDDARLIPGVPLSRETVYICNVLKCRPPENRNPLPTEVESCAPYLRRQLDALAPRVICCLGKFAAELLVGVKGTIGGLRGKVYRYKGAKLIVTYHPAALLRNPAYKRPLWEDMQLLAREYLTD